MSLDILNRTQLKISENKLQKSWLRLQVLLKKKTRINCSQKELSLVFFGEKKARELNKSYRKLDYATDVLSFEGDGVDHLGELVLCSRVISKQAKEHRLSVQQEVLYLFIHGVLHLLGYNHEHGGRQAKEMFKIFCLTN